MKSIALILSCAMSLLLFACTAKGPVANDTFTVRLNDSVGATRAPRYVQQGSYDGSGTPATNGTLVMPTNSIGAVTPNAGVNEVTHFVTVNGSEFEPNPIVLIGSTPVIGAVSVSDTVITFTVPTGIAPGTYDLTVQNVGMTAVVKPAAFTVYAPATITAISPPYGVRNQPINVTISGSNFRAGAVVRINGTAITVNSVAGSSISATVPANTFTAGLYNVTVQNPGELLKTLPSAYTVENPPVITAISPNSGFNYNTTAVTVTGNYFKPGIVTARIGAFTLTGITYVSATTFTATLSANNAPGSYTVSVQNAAQGLETSASNLFTVNALNATVTGISPSSALNSTGSTAVTITGTNFVGTPTAAANPTVNINGWALTSVVVVSPTQINATFSTGGRAPGAYNVNVTNYGATVGTLAGGFTVNAPPVVTVTNVAASSGTPGTTVTITGTNFLNGAVVRFGATNASTTFVNATTLTATVPSLTAGSYSVSVVNPFQSAVTWGGTFTVL